MKKKSLSWAMEPSCSIIPSFGFNCKNVYTCARMWLGLGLGGAWTRTHTCVRCHFFDHMGLSFASAHPTVHCSSHSSSPPLLPFHPHKDTPRHKSDSYAEPTRPLFLRWSLSIAESRAGEPPFVSNLPPFHSTPGRRHPSRRQEQ